MTVFFTVGQNAYHNGGKQSSTDQPEKNGNRVQYPSYLSAGVRFQLQGPGNDCGEMACGELITSVPGKSINTEDISPN